VRKAALFEGAHPSRSSLVEPPLGTSASLGLAFPLKHASNENDPSRWRLFHTPSKLMIWQDAAERQVPHPHVGFFCMLVRKPKLLNESAGSNDEST
jgi:hypothetical protein